MQDAAKLQELKRLLPQCLLPDQVRLGRQLAHALAASRHGTAAAPPLGRWLAEAKASISLRAERGHVRHALDYPPALPISAAKDRIIEAIRAHPVVVVAGETGSGKTTQLPKMCLEAGLGMRAQIGCTQPRRLAATSISRRLAEELQVTWGREVGCKIRFADQTRPQTSIKLMTDGILLAEVQSDPLLTEYEAIIVDEAHERSLNIDFLLGYLRLLLEKRHDLKVIITSATIDTQRFSQAFGGAPVLEVSGRMFPVEVRYRPLDLNSEEEGDLTYVEATADAVGTVLDESTDGDVLVFMPSERDIRETCDLLNTRHQDRLDIVPLFGRLSGAEQQQVFAPGYRRRVVVATNIAETSLTVPRIRYVIDPGLARMSRYHAGTRSKRLPIEPISQSSANQRKGRCGRVADGICVRLYSEEDFQERRPYTEPEIQRCNLADVILRMTAFQLGQIETFPFLDPPSPQAIQNAYVLLQELGALDEERALTRLGHDLARLPVDPTVGRMILEAHHEQALQEVLVIAAGLSIQDPRERPFDRKDAAEAAHRRFQNPRSDFLTLLNIWQAYHDTWESLKTQGQLRKFCKTHFLSFLRMREWVDLHAQLEDSIGDLGGFHWNTQPAPLEAIHRSILTGLCGQIAQREERNLYRVAGGRTAMVFPGSALFEKPSVQPKAARKHPGAAAGPEPKQPAWLVAGEIVETSRYFLRTLVGIEPDWVIELAPHLCRTVYQEPRWEAEAGNVLAWERVHLRGLLLRERRVSYARIQPAEATALFIRSALVEEDLPNPPPFVAHNRQLREKIELWQTRTHHQVVPDFDQALFDFYTRKLQPGVGAEPDPASGHPARAHGSAESPSAKAKHPPTPPRDQAAKDAAGPEGMAVASVSALRRFLHAHGGAAALCATEGDLLGEHTPKFTAGDFPDTVPVSGQKVGVSYAYAPGEERDGITFRLTVPLAQAIEPGLLDWLVPALREERVTQLLQLLPKTLRRPLMPLNVTARTILDHLQPGGQAFLPALSAFVRQRYGVDIPLAAWPVATLPEYLRPRFEIVGRDGKPLAAGRDLPALREAIRNHQTPEEQKAWQQAVERWERYGLTDWTLGDLPEFYPVSESSGIPLRAYPGLHLEAGDVNLRLFRRPEEALAASRQALPRLAEKLLTRELAWLQKDLRVLDKVKPYYVTLGSGDELQETAWENVRRHALLDPPEPPWTQQRFADYLERVRTNLRGLVPRLVALTDAILKKRHELQVCPKPYPNLVHDLNALVPGQFLRHIPFHRLEHLPRYLRAMQIRAERAAQNPHGDADKLRRVQPYLNAASEWCVRPNLPPAAHALLVEFLFLVQEFKVSCFAQELGTAVSVSTKKLDDTLAQLRQAALG